MVVVHQLEGGASLCCAAGPCCHVEAGESRKLLSLHCNCTVHYNALDDQKPCVFSCLSNDKSVLTLVTFDGRFYGSSHYWLHCTALCCTFFYPSCNCAGGSANASETSIKDCCIGSCLFWDVNACITSIKGS